MSFNSKYKSSEIEEILGSVGGKQNAINDLEEIRQGAAKGATAVQSISASVTTGSVTAGNFFNVTKDPSTGNVSIQMIQNTLASGKTAIPYTTDVKRYIDQAIANGGGGGASTDYVDNAIANAITNTLNTPV